MKIKTKPIAVAGLSAVCAISLFAGAGMLARKTVSAEDTQKGTIATSYFGDHLVVEVDGTEQEYELAKKFYDALDAINKNGDFKDGKVHYNITEKGVVTPDQIKAWVEDGDLTVPKAFSAARDAFLTDHPELFYIDFYKMTISAGRTDGVYAAFIDSGREANLYRDNGFITESDVDAAIKEFDTKLNKIVDDVKKAQAADTYSAKDVFYAREVNKKLAESITYDYAAYENKDDENYVAAAYINTAYGGIVEGKAVCGGFSTAYKAVMDKLGVPCITVNGYSNQMDEYGNYNPSSVYHMWNYVYLEAPAAAKSAVSARDASNGDWFSVDVTWNHSNPNRNKYAVLQKTSDEKIHVSDGVISSAKYELKYPELSAHNYGASAETDGIQFSFDYKPTGGNDDYGNALMDTFVTVSYNGKSAKRLLEEDGLYLVYRFATYSNGQIKWYNWVAIAPTYDYMSIVASIDGYMDDNGTETVLYENTAVYYMQFAVYDAVPDVESTPIQSDKFPEYNGKTFPISYTDEHLDKSQPVEISEAKVNETYGTYTPAPYVQSTTPNNREEQTIYDNMGRDGVMSQGYAKIIEVTYDEPLHKIDENKPITVFFESAHPNAKQYAKFYPVNDAGDLVEIVEKPKNSADSTLVPNTLRFKFGASLMYEHNREGYHFYFGNVGSAKIVTRIIKDEEGNVIDRKEEFSNKAPNAPYFTFSRMYLACPARFNYDGRLWVECCAQPVLADNSDLSANNFLKEDGTSSFSEGERSQMMLVAEKLGNDNTTLNNMKNEILGGDNNVVSEEELAKSETYDISLQICNKYPVIPDGSYVKIMLGFPEGYGPDDEGVRFKLYHRKHIKETDTYEIEEVPCVVTRLGIVATVTSFSPYMVVPVDADKVTDKTVYATIDGKGGKLSAEDGKTRFLKEGESYTYTINPDKGYQVYTVTINGKNVTDKVKDGKLTVNYADLADDNEIEIKYIANEAVQHVIDNNIVTPSKVVVNTDNTTTKVGDVIETPTYLKIVSDTTDSNSNTVAIIVIVVAVVVILALASVAIVLIVRKKAED